MYEYAEGADFKEREFGINPTGSRTLNERWDILGLFCGLIINAMVFVGLYHLLKVITL